MIQEILLLILIKLFNIVKSIVMGSRDMEQDAPSTYRFRMLKYEQVAPSTQPRQRLPLPRSGHRIVCDRRYMYSFGGYNPQIPADEVPYRDELDVHSFPLFQELWRFNLATKRWTRYESRETLPQELASNAVLREGNVLMVYGGTGAPFGHRCSNQLYICPLTGDEGKMTEITTTGQLPLPQYGQALIFHDNYLYTIGGTTGFSYTCDIHRLSMKTQTWENVYICQGNREYEPKGRYRHEVAFDGRCIYLLGGGTAEMAFDFEKLPVFDLETREWREVKTQPDPKCRYVAMPPARRCHGLVQVQNDDGLKVFISGGFDGMDVYDDLWQLNLRTMQWMLISTCKLPYPTYFHSTAVTPEGKMFVFGGIYIKEEQERNNLVHAVWLCIPKLSEMCWEALLHYRPKIVDCTKTKLLRDIGLPRHFVDRLD